VGGVVAGGGQGEGAAPAAVDLDAAASELLAPEVQAVLERVQAPEARAPWLGLQAAIAQGRVTEAHLPALEQVLRLGIETGRFERVHGRAADTLARGLYARTPTGRAAAEQATAVSNALGALAGSRLLGCQVAADGPAAYRLRLATDRGEVLLRFDRAGVRIDSVEVAE
jgi:hypothetical protein